MKLEFKHLSAYLPYGLKVNIITNPCKDEIHILSGILYDGLLKLGSGGMYGFLQRSYKDIKPILRPLSDLAREIDHNGQKFVPFDFLNENYSPIDDYEALQKHFIKEGTMMMPYELVSQLIEWHFDIFGLIEAELAIDINTL